MPRKIILGVTLNLSVAMIVAFIFAGGIIKDLSAFVMNTTIFLLYPIEAFQNAGIWSGIIGVTCGGFVGGLICNDYNKAAVSSILSIVSLITILMSISPYALQPITLAFDLNTIINISLAWMLTFLGALAGVLMIKK